MRVAGASYAMRVQRSRRAPAPCGIGAAPMTAYASTGTGYTSVAGCPARSWIFWTASALGAMPHAVVNVTPGGSMVPTVKFRGSSVEAALGDLLTLALVGLLVPIALVAAAIPTLIAWFRRLIRR